MKVLGTFLVVIGIALLTFPIVKYFLPEQVQMKDVHPVEWPTVTGLGALMVGGMALYAAKKM